MEENQKPRTEEDQSEDNEAQADFLGQWESELFGVPDEDLEKKEKKKKLAAKQKRIANIFKKVIPKIELTETETKTETDSDYVAPLESGIETNLTDQPQITVITEVELGIDSIGKDEGEMSHVELKTDTVLSLQIDREPANYRPATDIAEITISPLTAPTEISNEFVSTNKPHIFTNKNFNKPIMEKITPKKEQKPKPKEQSLLGKLFFGNSKKRAREEFSLPEIKKSPPQSYKNFAEVMGHRPAVEKPAPKYYEKPRPNVVESKENNNQKSGGIIELSEPVAKSRELRYKAIDEDFAKGAIPVGAFFQDSAFTDHKDSDLAQLASAKSLRQVIAKQKSLEKAQKELYPKAIKSGILAAAIVLAFCWLAYINNIL